MCWLRTMPRQGEREESYWSRWRETGSQDFAYQLGCKEMIWIWFTKSNIVYVSNLTCKTTTFIITHHQEWLRTCFAAIDTRKDPSPSQRKDRSWNCTDYLSMIWHFIENIPSMPQLKASKCFLPDCTSMTICGFLMKKAGFAAGTPKAST